MLEATENCVRSVIPPQLHRDCMNDSSHRAKEKSSLAQFRFYQLKRLVHTNMYITSFLILDYSVLTCSCMCELAGGATIVPEVLYSCGFDQ